MLGVPYSTLRLELPAHRLGSTDVTQALNLMEMNVPHGHNSEM